MFFAFIDFSKVFGSVSGIGLWQKVLNYNIIGNFFQDIQSTYINIKSCVKVPFSQDDATSSNIQVQLPYDPQTTNFFQCIIGVGQGENTFLNDLDDILILKITMA